MTLYRGWNVVIAAAGINFLVGINYTWSIYATGLVVQRGWTHPQAALPYALFLFCYAICMVFTGRAQDLWGPRPVITVGSFFAGGAFIACAFFLDIPAVAAVLWGVLLGMGLACCFASTSPAAMKWFTPERKGFVTGLVVTSTGLAALVISPLVQMLVGICVEAAFIISGAVLTMGIFILAQFIYNPPGRIKDLREWFVSRRTRPAKRSPLIFYLWLMFFLTTGTGVTIAAHLDNIMRIQAGYDRGYIAVALFALFNAAGRTVGGILSDRLGRMRVMTVIFSAIAFALLFFMAARTPMLLMAAVSVVGLAFGGLFTIFPAAVVTLFGESNFGLKYGLIFTGLGVAGIFPYLGGALFELQDSYTSTFALLLATTLAALSISFIIRRHVKNTG